MSDSCTFWSCDLIPHEPYSTQLSEKEMLLSPQGLGEVLADQEEEMDECETVKDVRLNIKDSFLWSLIFHKRNRPRLTKPFFE